MPALSIACPHCQTAIKLKSAASIGKKARCPKCQQVFVVPAAKAQEDEFAELLAADADQFEDYGVDEEGADDPYVEAAPSRSSSGRSKKGKKKRKSRGGGGAMKGVLITLAVLAVLGLLGGGAYLAVAYLPLGFGSPSRMAWLPDDTEALTEVRVADLWNAPALQPLKTAQVTTGVTDSLMDQYGIRPEDIDKLVIGKPAGGGAAADWVGVVYTKLPLTEQQRSAASGGTQPVSYNGAEYFLAAGGGRAVYFPRENVAVYGPEHRVKAAIDAKGKCAAEDRFAFAPSGHQLTVASLNASGARSAAPLPGVDSLSAESLKSAAMMIDADTDLRLSAQLVCVSSEKAAQAAQELTAARDKQLAELAQRKAQLQQAAAAMAALRGQASGSPQISPETAQAAIDSLEQSLQSVQATSSGETVHASISVSGQTIAALADMISMFSSTLPGLFGGGATTPTFPMPNQPAPYPGR
jgi:predicted Zn finger-like uncharacterized protein